MRESTRLVGVTTELGLVILGLMGMLELCCMMLTGGVPWCLCCNRNFSEQAKSYLGAVAASQLAAQDCRGRTAQDRSCDWLYL